MSGKPNGAAPPQVVAQIAVALTVEGHVIVQAQVPNRKTMLMMLEEAKEHLLEQIRAETRKRPSVIPEAPPGIVFDRNPNS